MVEPRFEMLAPPSVIRIDRSDFAFLSIILTSSRQRKTFIVLVLAILVNAAGNLCISYGMKSIGAPAEWSVRSIGALVAAAFSSQAVWIGLPLLMVFFLLFLSLLSWADLSFVLPMISYCFVVNALLARLVLGERIPLVRWTGIILVSAGIFLVSKSTAHPKPAEEQET